MSVQIAMACLNELLRRLDRGSVGLAYRPARIVRFTVPISSTCMVQTALVIRGSEISNTRKVSINALNLPHPQALCWQREIIVSVEELNFI